MKKLLALLALLALLPALAFGATATSVCISDVGAATGGDIVIFEVNTETAACAVEAARADSRVYLMSSNLQVTQILAAMLPDSGRIIAVGPAMTASGLAKEINDAIGVVLTELGDDENDDFPSDPLLLSVHAVITSLAHGYGWRVI
jgi:hypothetical protein